MATWLSDVFESQTKQGGALVERMLSVENPVRAGVRVEILYIQI